MYQFKKSSVRTGKVSLSGGPDGWKKLCPVCKKIQIKAHLLCCNDCVELTDEDHARIASAVKNSRWY